jgi:hypothetical protein
MASFDRFHSWSRATLVAMAVCSMGLHCDAPCPERPETARYESRSSGAVGPQLVLLHGDVAAGLDLSLSVTTPVRLALVRADDIHDGDRFRLDTIGVLADAVHDAPASPEDGQAPPFHLIGADPADGDVHVRVEPGEIAHGFDNLLLVPMAEEAFDLTLRLTQPHEWRVLRGHHGQCNMMDEAHNDATNDERHQPGDIVPLATSGA